MSKTVSKVFIIIGWILNFIMCISAITQGYTGYAIGLGIVWFIGFILGCAALALTEKHIGLGIGMIFFVSPLAGIFYLCWDGR